MRYDYNPNSDYEKFGLQTYNLLVEKFAQTYFVGGMVRDLLLQREVTDIDIATSALPEEIITLLEANNIQYIEQGKQFGVITAVRGNQGIEITTLRTEEYQESRFPKVRFITSPEEDSQRRDFTVNALYYNFAQSEILDFHNGWEDLNNKILRFIGDPEIRIKQDPLRIVRAYRFKFSLQFDFSTDTERALINSSNLLKTLSAQRVENEINKISDQNVQQELRKVIHKFA